MFNVLFLCTGNSARSILAEAILNRDGAGRMRAFSAGSNPAGRVHPAAMDLLARRGVAVAGLRSKNWEEFAAPGAPEMDLVITLCDAAAAEPCPAWTGSPSTAHWTTSDPAAAAADQIPLAFQLAYHQLSARINAMLALPLETLARDVLSSRLAVAAAL